jgi:hypothetical protein
MAITRLEIRPFSLFESPPCPYFRRRPKKRKGYGFGPKAHIVYRRENPLGRNDLATHLHCGGIIELKPYV